MTIIASMWTSVSPAPFRAARALACIAVAACLVAADSPPLTGMWGGADALLAIDALGGRLQTGCTLVRFAAVSPDADGRFQTSAHAATLQLAPPVTDGEDDKALPDPAEMPATLSGRIGGGGIDLSLSIQGQPARALHLVAGQRGALARCL